MSRRTTNPKISCDMSKVHITPWTASSTGIVFNNKNNNCKGSCSINENIQNAAKSGIYKHQYTNINCENSKYIKLINITLSLRFPWTPKYSLAHSSIHIKNNETEIIVWVSIFKQLNCKYLKKYIIQYTTIVNIIYTVNKSYFGKYQRYKRIKPKWKINDVKIQWHL